MAPNFQHESLPYFEAYISVIFSAQGRCSEHQYRLFYIEIYTHYILYMNNIHVYEYILIIQYDLVGLLKIDGQPRKWMIRILKNGPRLWSLQQHNFKALPACICRYCISIYVYTMHTYIYIHTDVYIYIFIYLDRYIDLQIYRCIYIYIDIYL